MSQSPCVLSLYQRYAISISLSRDVVKRPPSLRLNTYTLLRRVYTVRRRVAHLVSYRESVYTTPARYSPCVSASCSCFSPLALLMRGFFLGATSGIFSTMISARGFSGSSPQYVCLSLTCLSFS